MPTLPPHDRPHHEIRAGAENLPLEAIEGTQRLDVPLGLGVKIEAQTGTDLDEKDFPRRRFDVRNARELRGAVLLKFTILFFIGDNTMNAIIAWIRQPTTLQGFALLIFAATGLFSKVLSSGQASTFALAALPLIGIKDNTTTILHQTQANADAIAGEPALTPKA